MRLEGKGVIVRDLEVQDAVSLTRYADNRNIWINLRDRFPHPYCLADAEAWIKHSQSKADPDRSYAIEKDGEVIGNVGCTFYQAERRHVADVGYWIGEPFWGQGIGTQTFGMYSDYLFAHSEVIRQEAAVLRGTQDRVGCWKRMVLYRKGV